MVMNQIMDAFAHRPTTVTDVGENSQLGKFGKTGLLLFVADGGSKRRQRKVKLGSVAEIPYQSQAEERLAVFMRQKPATLLTFSELVEKWKMAVVPTLKDSTASNYQYNAEKYLIPAFGSREVSSLTRFDVESFLAAKASAYCRNTLRGMRATLRSPFVGGPKRLGTEECLPRCEAAESRQTRKASHFDGGTDCVARNECAGADCNSHVVPRGDWRKSRRGGRNKVV
jgi:Phage integrase, N-terminal SAM-like domain